MIAAEDHREILHILVDQAREYGIFMLNPEGYILSWNAGAERMKGYKESEILGQHFSRFYTFEDVNAGHPAWGLARAEADGKFEDEGWRLRRDGSRFCASVLITRLEDKEGKLRGFSILTRDISERRQAQEELRRREHCLREELEQRVDARTLELQRSLVETTTLLKELHHRVKNNLQVVCSLLNMQIACAGADSLSTRPLQDAHSRVLAMALIHEQIYQTETLADVDFHVYIKLLAERLFDAYCIDTSRIQLQMDLDVIHLTVDEAIPCGLILNELLSNSLKHAFPGGRKGVIRIRLRSFGDGFVELAVSDDGKGLPAGFQHDKSQSLGLQVVQTLVHQLRGNLSVSRDEGTTFGFRWQLA